MIKVTLIKSTIGALPAHRKTIQALGLNKMNSFNIHTDNDAIRGMVKKVAHLVRVEEYCDKSQSGGEL